ncbi:hypothetical protein [uncultured Polaribacter sp.]|uniref:alpha/beta fold hydrolase n=1 Tax=uncultured Polaribacter sp. TaxID=174711 RepID=UPI002613B8C5|nr:hypothetical protein [uncultured Polaribacter sp.]
MINKLYNSKLKTFKTSFTEKDIITSFGKTHVIIFGDEGKPALFLLHGLNTSAPFAFSMVSFLAEKYQIFAVDILGEPNQSDFVRINKKDTSYGKWLQEVINHFQLNSFSFCGISFGAFPILQSLLIDEKKVNEVFLISPAGIVNGSLPKTIFRFLIPMRKFRKTKNEIHLKQCLSNIYDEFDEFTYPYLKEVFLHFKMDFSITPNFKTSALKKIQTPITIIASKDDFFVPALKLKRRSKKTFASIKKFIVLENSKHVPAKSILKANFNI